MSEILPVGISSDPGISPNYAPLNHQHRLWDKGERLVLNADWVDVSPSLPLMVYKSGDWIYIEGVVRNTPAVVSSVIAILPVGYRPFDFHYFMRLANSPDVNALLPTEFYINPTNGEMRLFSAVNYKERAILTGIHYRMDR